MPERWVMDRKKVFVYQVTHQEKCKKMWDYLIPVQAGAALTKERIAELTDQSGEQISEKNQAYCELTVLYWAWKNRKSPIWGLCHYQRIFTFSNQEEIEKILQQYDWITATSYCFRINLEKEYQKYHLKEDMDVLKKVLKDRKDGSYEAALNVLSKNRLYPYNMLIASQEKMEEYCTWLFDILFQIEQKTRQRNRTPYQKRYIGFLAERLMTIYIWKKQLQVYEDPLIGRKMQNNRKQRIHSAINHQIFLLKQKIERKEKNQKGKGW